MTKEEAPLDPDLDLLRRRYLQMVPINELSLDSIRPPVTSKLQDELLCELFLSRPPVVTKNLANAEYAGRFLKKLIDKVEECVTDEEDEEIDDRFYELYASIIASPQITPLELAQMTAVVTYTIPSIPRLARSTIMIEEKRNLFSGSGHTGSRTWEAALAFGEYLIQSERDDGENLLHGKTVLELGAGTGVLSILASRLGAKRIIATDGEASVCENTARNIALNSPGGGEKGIIDVRQLVWGAENESEPVQDALDIIIGSDLTYDLRILEDLVYTITTLLRRNRDATAVIAAAVRNEETVSTFEKICRQTGLIIHSEMLKPPSPPIFFYSNAFPNKAITIQYPSPEPSQNIGCNS